MLSNRIIYKPNEQNYKYFNPYNALVSEMANILSRFIREIVSYLRLELRA